MILVITKKPEIVILSVVWPLIPKSRETPGKAISTQKAKLLATVLLKMKLVSHILNSEHTALADPRGGARDARPPPGGPNSFIFMQFSAKMWKIIAILGVGAPPWGKSWIRHCTAFNFQMFTLFFTRIIFQSRQTVKKRRYLFTELILT